jgi:putative protease
LFGQALGRAAAEGRAKTMEKLIGQVSHYFNRIGVAVLELSGGLMAGDVVHIQGHTTDFEQAVESMEIRHQQVQSVGPGAEVALHVIERVRKGDAVYKVFKGG